MLRHHVLTLVLLSTASVAYGQIAYQPRPSRHVAVPTLSPTGAVIAFGDSKTLAETFPSLMVAIQPGLSFDTVTGIENGVIARNGSTVASMGALLVSDLAAIADNLRVQYVLFNLGANETGAMPVEATWIANAQAIIDKMVIKWPGVQVYIMRPWVRGQLANCNTIAGWIDTLVASRPNTAHLGPDERVWMEGGDDGATMTNDGIHPNVAGNVECAAQWLAVLGY